MTDKQTTLYLAKLTEFGYSNTAPRRRVFEEILLSSHQLLSIGEIVSRLKTRVDRASVYRNIQVLEDCQLIHKVFVGWKYRLELSDEFSVHHHHITCIECGRIEELVAESKIETLLQNISKASGYRHIGHQLELSGICKSCQQHGTPGTPEVLGKPHTSN